MYTKYILIPDSISSIMLKSSQKLLWHRGSNIYIIKGFLANIPLQKQNGPTTNMMLLTVT